MRNFGTERHTENSNGNEISCSDKSLRRGTHITLVVTWQDGRNAMRDVEY